MVPISDIHETFLTPSRYTLGGGALLQQLSKSDEHPCSSGSLTSPDSKNIIFFALDPREGLPQRPWSLRPETPKFYYIKNGQKRFPL